MRTTSTRNTLRPDGGADRLAIAAAPRQEGANARGAPRPPVHKPPPLPCPPPPAATGPPISLARILKRRPSFTMPGSLFPRSPSMEPDAHRPPASVRSRPVPHRRRPSHPLKPILSSTCLSVHAQHSTAPWGRRGCRRRPVPHRRGRRKPCDPPPSPRISPHASPRAAKGKGKARADAPATPDADSSGLLRVRGKEQELDAARADLGRHEWRPRVRRTRGSGHVVRRAGRAR